LVLVPSLNLKLQMTVTTSTPRRGLPSSFHPHAGHWAHDRRSTLVLAEPNRSTVQQLLEYAYQQGIAHRLATPDEVFPSGVMTKVVV
jgi:hypothetical protein